MANSITKKHGDECTQAELEDLAAKAGCKPDELVFKSNDGEGTYTISAPTSKGAAKTSAFEESAARGKAAAAKTAKSGK